MTKTDCAEVPIFCDLALSDTVRKGGFDPDHQGPEAAGEFPGFALSWEDYEMDYTDPRWWRTRTMQEVFADIPTGVWPTIGGEDGGRTAAEFAMASAEGVGGVPEAG